MITQTFYPYEVQFWRAAAWGCMPCKTLKEAKEKAAKYADGDRWRITKKDSRYEQEGRVILRSPDNTPKINLDASECPFCYQTFDHAPGCPNDIGEE